MTQNDAQEAIKFYTLKNKELKENISRNQNNIEYAVKSYFELIDLKIGDKFKIEGDNEVYTLNSFGMDYRGIFGIHAEPINDMCDVYEPCFGIDVVFKIKKA